MTTTNETTETTETDAELVTCDHCGARVNPDDTHRVDGRVWCQECTDSDAMTCDRCDGLASADEHRTVYAYSTRRGRMSEESWCPSCVDDHSTTCDHCDERVDSDSTVDVAGSQWCRSCVDDDASTCDACGEVFPSDDMHSVDDGSEYLCTTCHRERDDERVIGSYHSTRNRGFAPIRLPYTYSRRPGWYGTPRSALLFGVELEIESTPRTTPEDIARTVQRRLGRLFAGAERDGSLRDGVEIVSQPATIDAHREEWSRVMSTPGKLAPYSRAHDTETCGFHVHCTREACTDLTWAKLVDLLTREHDQSRWSTIFRRTPNHYAKANRKRKFSDGRQIDPDRYQIVNTSSSKTVEIRWPRGTVQPATVLATIEIIHAAIRYCETASVRALTIDHFLHAIVTDPWLRSETKTARQYLADRTVLTASIDPRVGKPRRRPSTTATPEFD